MPQFRHFNRRGSVDSRLGGAAESPVKAQRVAIQKDFLETVSRTTKLLVSSAVILLLLIVVVGQELREYREKQSILANEITKTALNRRRLNKKLNEQYKEIQSTLKGGLKQRAQIEPTDLPTAVRLIRSNRDIDFLIRGEQEVKAVKTRVEQRRLEERKEESEQNKRSRNNIAFEAKEAQSRPNQFVDEPFIDRLVSDRPVRDQPLIESPDYGNDRPPALVLLNGDGSNDESNEANKSDELTKVITQITRYGDIYHEYTVAAGGLFDKLKEAEELNSSKKSIPTPFGNFQVPPKLALLALSFAVVILYFTFYTASRNTLKLARDYYATGEKDEPRSELPSPYWLFVPNSTEYGRLGVSHVQRSIALALHLAWLVIAGWLLVESLWRWNAPKALRFDYKDIWSSLLIAFFVIALVSLIWLILSISTKEKISTLAGAAKQRVDGRSRRAFISFGAVALFGAATGSAIYLFRRSSTHKQQICTNVSAEGLAFGNSLWVRNKKSMKIHHREICWNHLPSELNTELSVDTKGTLCVHSGWSPLILEQFARDALADKRYELAIQFLSEAINLRPFRFHLYDMLVNTYGKAKAYSKIDSLLNNALATTEMALSNQTKLATLSKKEKQRLLQAKNEFKLRIEGAKLRKQLGEKYRAMKTAEAKAGKSKRRK